MLPFVQHEPAIRIDPPISPLGVPALFSESNAFVMLLGLLTMALSTKLAMPSFRREPILYGLLNGPTLASTGCFRTLISCHAPASVPSSTPSNPRPTAPSRDCYL